MEHLLDLLGSPWLTDALQSEMTKMTLSFIIAARLHRKWVKKDLSEQFKILTDAINNVTSSLSDGLALHSKRIDELSNRVDDLEHKEVKPIIKEN